MVEIDPKRLQQVSLNLLTNAMKFSKAGGKVELGGKILTEKRDSKIRQYVEIFVKDTGYGISKEDQGKLFKLFGKLTQKNGLNKQGIGLGLHICKQICELFDGSIDVESEIGMGSKFFFKFMISETSYT
jgi:signal transduction histidine kinase